MPAKLYPWAKWFNGQRFILKKGIDYSCMTHSMIAQIRNRASKCEDPPLSIQLKTSEDVKGERIILEVRPNA